MLKSFELNDSVFVEILFSQSLSCKGLCFQNGTVGYEVYRGPGTLYFSTICFTDELDLHTINYVSKIAWIIEFLMLSNNNIFYFRRKNNLSITEKSNEYITSENCQSRKDTLVRWLFAASFFLVKLD